MISLVNNDYIQKWEHSGYTVTKVNGSINYSIENSSGKIVNVLQDLEDCRRFIDFLCCN